MASNLVNVNLCYIEIELCIAQLRTQVRGNILAVSISGAALPNSAVWTVNMFCHLFSVLRLRGGLHWHYCPGPPHV